MTSARETTRASHGKAEASIGISKVPDPRLDRLTAMFNPKKRVPATVEFSDLAAQGRAGGAQALVDVAAYKNADALVHVLRAFEDPSVAHPSGSVNPARDAQAMEDELILADLGVAERRLERLEKDLKKNRTADLERERDVVTLCRSALEEGRPLRSLDLKGEELKRLRGFQFLSAKPLLIVINLDEAQLTSGGQGATRHRAGRRRGGPHTVSLARGNGGGSRVREDRARNRPARRRGRDSIPFRSRPLRVGTRSRHSRHIRAPRLHFLLHRRRRRVPRLVDSSPHAGPGWPRARFTAILRAGSSGPRSSRTTH